MKSKKAYLQYSIKALAIVIGLLFPFLIWLWKILIFIMFFILLVIEDRDDTKLIGVRQLFFIALIISFLIKLLITN